MALKARVRVGDNFHRYSTGEVGLVIPNDYPEKYTYKVLFEGTMSSPFGEIKREFYFWEGELEFFGE